MTNQTKSGYAPNSDRPPFGWPITIALGVAVSLLFFFIPNIVFWIVK